MALSKIVTQGLVNGVDVATEADLAARQGEGLDDSGSGDDHFPWTPTGQVLPAIVPDQVATQPIRVGRAAVVSAGPFDSRRPSTELGWPPPAAVADHADPDRTST